MTLALPFYSERQSLHAIQAYGKSGGRLVLTGMGAVVPRPGRQSPRGGRFNI